MRLLSEFPDFYKNDLVTYYAGSSLEEMDMRGIGKDVPDSRHDMHWRWHASDLGVSVLPSGLL